MKKLIFFLCAATWAQIPGVLDTTVTSSSTPSFTAQAAFQNFNFTLTSNATATFSSPATGMGTFRVCQDGTGGRTMTWPGNFVGFPSVASAANACIEVFWKYDGTNVTVMSNPAGLSAAANSVFTGSTASTVASSASPAFSLADVSVKSPIRFEISPVVNVTGPTITNKTAGAKFDIAVTTDGSHTWTWNSIVTDNVCPIYTAAAATTVASLEIGADGTTVHGVGCQLIINGLTFFGASVSASSTAPGSGNIDCRMTSAGYDCIDNSSVHWIMLKAGQDVSATGTVTSLAHVATTTATDTANVVYTNAARTMAALLTIPGGDLFNGGVDAQSGTSYTMVAADGNKLLTFNNGSSVAVTLPQATTTGFTSGAFFTVFNRGAGAVTITPTTSTINGSATVTLNQNQGAFIVSDGTNYSAWVSAAPTGGGTVTSVGLTSTDFSVSGTPVTTSGSITANLTTALKTRGLQFEVGDPTASSALTTSNTAYLTVPFACTIGGYNLNIDASDTTFRVKFWKVATGTAIPTSGNSISTSGLGVPSGTAIHSTTTSDFTTTTVTANDIIAMNVATANTVKYISGVLQCGQ